MAEEFGPLPYTPSVLTSEVYNEAEVIFTLLQNKEKLVSFLDCTTLLRGMGMSPTYDDMRRLKARMAEPVFKLEQWRREEELKREKERRKEEAKERKGRGGMAPRESASSKKAKQEAVEKQEVADKPVKVIPVEEIKNIDWNIFITCAEEIYRDTAKEETILVEAIRVFKDDEDCVTSMPTERLIEIVTTHGESVLTPAEAKQLRATLPEECTFAELASRIQGTYIPPTQEELDRIAAEALAARRKREEEEKAAAEDPLAGL